MPRVRLLSRSGNTEWSNHSLGSSLPVGRSDSDFVNALPPFPKLLLAPHFVSSGNAMLRFFLPQSRQRLHPGPSVMGQSGSAMRNPAANRRVPRFTITRKAVISRCCRSHLIQLSRALCSIYARPAHFGTASAKSKPVNEMGISGILGNGVMSLALNRVVAPWRSRRPEDIGSVLRSFLKCFKTSAGAETWEHPDRAQDAVRVRRRAMARVAHRNSLFRLCRAASG